MTTKVQRERGPLTPEQIAFYEAFGFLMLRQAFSIDEMKIIERNLKPSCQRCRRTHRSMKANHSLWATLNINTI